jgi:hypothetical protein
MSLRLTGLREAALREYPDYGQALPPVPWYLFTGRLLQVVMPAVAAVVLVLTFR